MRIYILLVIAVLCGCDKDEVRTYLNLEAEDPDPSPVNYHNGVDLDFVLWDLYAIPEYEEATADAAAKLNDAVGLQCFYSAGRPWDNLGETPPLGVFSISDTECSPGLLGCISWDSDGGGRIRIPAEQAVDMPLEARSSIIQHEILHRILNRPNENHSSWGPFSNGLSERAYWEIPPEELRMVYEACQAAL